MSTEGIVGCFVVYFTISILVMVWFYASGRDTSESAAIAILWPVWLVIALIKATVRLAVEAWREW